MKLRRYWFKFDIPINGIYPLGLLAGCGVTAYNYEDAFNLLQNKVFINIIPPSIQVVIEDVDVSTLDKDHVLPNIGISALRGIWFPRGYN